MKRPCSVSLTGCPGVDSPITNVSAEAPDPLLFWAKIWNPYNPYRPIPLGPGQYVLEDCDDLINAAFAIYDPIVYANTQLEANLQALAVQLGCAWPPPTPGQVYTNDAQTATVYCADGTSFTYTVPSGTIFSRELDPILGAAWLEWANAWAANYALEQASALISCVVNEPDPDDQPPESPGDDPPTPTPPPSGGSIPNVVWVCRGAELHRTYRISGNDLIAFNFSIVEGSIPTGTLFEQTEPRKSVVSGFPSAAGEYQFKIRAVSVTEPIITSETWATIFVFGITNPELPNGQLGVAYSHVLVAAGGTAPYTFELATGSDPLPDGLTLASDGTISGTPTVEDTFNFTVKVTDTRGGTCDEDLTISVGICPDWTTLLWGAPTYTPHGGVALSFIPVSADDNEFTADVLAMDSSTDYGTVSNTATITVDGNPCNCNLHVNLTRFNSGGIVSQGSVYIQIPPPGISLFWTFSAPTPEGQQDIPFSLPDNGGVPYVITVTVTVAQNQVFPGLIRQTTLNGIISNVP